MFLSRFKSVITIHPRLSAPKLAVNITKWVKPILEAVRGAMAARNKHHGVAGDERMWKNVEKNVDTQL